MTNPKGIVRGHQDLFILSSGVACLAARRRRAAKRTVEPGSVRRQTGNVLADAHLEWRLALGQLGQGARGTDLEYRDLLRAGSDRVEVFAVPRHFQVFRIRLRSPAALG